MLSAVYTQKSKVKTTALALTVVLHGTLLSAAAMAGKDYANANYTSYSGFTVNENPVFPQTETHPSLWGTKQDLLRSADRFKQEVAMRRYWQAVKQHRLLSVPLPAPITVNAGKKGIQKYYGDMTQIALYNGFMVWMEKKGTARQKFYLRRAVEALQRAYDGPVYQLDPARDGIDKSVDEIYRGVWNQNLAAAYDFVQPFLSPAEDHSTRARLIEEAEYTFKNLESWTSGPHNHLSKPAWGLASLALALNGHPNARQWFSRAIRAANRNTAYHFSADGIYREGAQYYVFSWLNFVPFLYHYRNVAGVDLFGDFQAAMEWSLKARNGRGWMMNIEDSFLRPVPTQMVAPAYMNQRSELNADVPFGELLQWGFVTTDFTPFDIAKRESGYNYTGASWDYPKELYELLTYRPDIKASAPAIDPTVFMSGGQSIFRNQWTDADFRQQYLLFHGVPHADNHDHHDQLSFVLYAQGQIMASDQGYTRSSYGDEIRYAWYRTAPAHNTLTYNGIPLGDHVENQPAPSADKLNTAFFDFEEKSAPFRDYLQPPVGAATRAIAYVQGDYFLVLDSLRAPKKGQFTLYFHAGRAALEAEGSQYLWRYHQDTYGPAASLLFQPFSQAAQAQVLAGETTYIKNDYLSTPYLRLQKAATHTLFAQLLYPLAEGEEKPTVSDLGSDDYLAAAIRTRKGEDIFLKQADRKWQSVNRLRSDARFLWLRELHKTLVKIAGQDLTSATWAGAKVLTLSRPATLAFEYKTDSVAGGYVAAHPTSASINVRGKTIRSVSVNSRQVPFSTSSSFVNFELAGSGTFTIAYAE